MKIILRLRVGNDRNQIGIFVLGQEFLFGVDLLNFRILLEPFRQDTRSYLKNADYVQGQAHHNNGG
jgi:hypothetical protein